VVFLTEFGKCGNGTLIDSIAFDAAASKVPRLAAGLDATAVNASKLFDQGFVQPCGLRAKTPHSPI